MTSSCCAIQPASSCPTNTDNIQILFKVLLVDVAWCRHIKYHPSKRLKNFMERIMHITIWHEHCSNQSAKKCGKSHLWHFPFLGGKLLLQTQENVTRFLILLIKVEYALDVACFLQADVWSLEHCLYSFKHIAIIHWSSRIGEIKGFCAIRTHNVVTIIIGNFVTSIWSNPTYLWNVWQQFTGLTISNLTYYTQGTELTQIKL